MRVLVVDDDVSILGAIQHTLEAEGVEVVLARSGNAAAIQVELHSFDAILLDPDALEDKDAEFHRRLRALPRDVPVLVLSARSLGGSMPGLRTPATKRQPIETNALIEQVRQAARAL